MKNKIIAFSLAAMMVVSLAACGSSSQDSQVSEEFSENSLNVEDTENETEIADNESSVNENDAEEEEAQESIVLLDSDNLYVEYQGIEEYSDSTWIIDLYIENNRESDVYVSLRDGLVNKYCIGFANNSNSITAGSKYLSSANYDYIIDVEDLEMCGISDIETLEFDLYISEEFAGDPISETPVSLEANKTINSTENADFSESGDVLVDSDGIYIESRGIADYSSSALIVNLYIENNSDSEICISLTDGMANGYSIKFANNGLSSIPENAKYLAVANYDYIIDKEDLEAYSLTTLETVEFTLKVKNELLGDSIVEVPVTLTPNIEIKNE